MTTSKTSLTSLPLSLATVSVGNPHDPLPDKLSAISRAGFQGIELGFPDLISFSCAFHSREIRQDDYDSLCSAGSEVAKLCERWGLEIIMLQPLTNFEGWERGSRERREVFARAEGWIRIMRAVGTDMLQLGSIDSHNISTSLETLASDIRELADLLAAHSFRLAYENWCWATVTPTWSQAWEMVKRIDRCNVGLCLDTFQTCGGEYGDPTTASGVIEDQGEGEGGGRDKANHDDLERRFRESLGELTRRVPGEKIYVLQISDAYKPPTPLEDKVVDGLRPRGRWSRDFRPCVFDGGYLTKQCVEFAKAVLATGARCWISVEVFDGEWDGGGVDRSWYDKGEFCRGAMERCRKLLRACEG